VNEATIPRNPAGTRPAFDQDVVRGAGDREGILRLAELTFPGEDLASPDFLAWMYDRNPNGRAIEFVTKSGALVTGHCAAVPMRCKLGEDVRPASIAVNGMTHPDFRGRGIFSRLYGEVTAGSAGDGMALTFGFPNSNSLNACLRHLNFRDIGEFPLWLLPLRPGAILAARDAKRAGVWKRAGALAEPAFRLGQALLRPRSGRGGWTIERPPAFGPEFEALWDEAKRGFRYGFVRDSAFLDWRFARHPTRSYEILTARHRGRLAGYLVGRTLSLEGLTWNMIVDLLVPPTREGRTAGRRLVAAYGRASRDAGADLLGALALKPTEGARALRRLGFLVCPKKLLPRRFSVLLSWNGPDAPPGDIFDLAAWHLNLGDYDAV
jgi:hypothetical protein